MKKITAIILLFVFLFCGCSAQADGKSIGSFTENAHVTFKNFNYDCTVVYNGKSVTLSAQSTSAAGLVLTYDGKTVGISYDDISLSQINNNFDSSNPAIALYEAFECANSMPETDIGTVKSGYIVSGKTSIGSFTLETNSDFYPVSIVFNDAELSFDFTK